MMSLQNFHNEHGATLAPDGIPLHYGDLAQEYEAVLHQAVLLDRSHEGRLQLFGADRYELLNRMSTNETINMEQNEGRPTIFTNANGRVIDRVVVYNRSDHLLLITEAGRGAAVRGYVQRNIFFNDDARLVDISEATNQLALHGPKADAVLSALSPEAATVTTLYGHEFSWEGATVYAVRRKEISGSHWALIVPAESAGAVAEALHTAGRDAGLRLAGSLTYNTVRIRAGRPARAELNTDYIPLELGLWDEVHFSKGCYTGQEIIARMESRGKLAKTIVALHLSEFVPAPADVHHEGQRIGKMTSSVQAPDGECFAMGVLKTQLAAPDTPITVGEQAAPGRIGRLLGVQRPTA